MLYIVVGPSGSGKTTLSRIMEEKGIARVISSTTRDMRPGEKNNVDYIFLSNDEFQKDIDNNNFIEYSRFGNNLYGTRKKDIQTALSVGKKGNAVVVMDINGFQALKNSGFNVKGIFLDVSYDTLIKRLDIRDFNEKEKRISLLRQEKENIKYFKNEIILSENKIDEMVSFVNHTILDV